MKCKVCGQNKPADNAGVVCLQCRKKRAGKSLLYCVECGSFADRRYPSLCRECEEKLTHEEIFVIAAGEIETFPWDKLQEALAPLIEEYNITPILETLSEITGMKIRAIPAWAEEE